MLDLSFLEPVKQLLDQPDVADKVDELGRLFFSSNGITVNLMPVIMIGLVALMLLLLPFFGTSIVDLLRTITGTSTTGYTHTPGYYTASRNDGNISPSSGYGNSYITWNGDEVDPTPEHFDLRGQIESLQASEKNQREHIYFNPAKGAEAGSRTASPLPADSPLLYLNFKNL